jgi:hypothetical protein
MLDGIVFKTGSPAGRLLAESAGQWNPSVPWDAQEPGGGSTMIRKYLFTPLRVASVIATLGVVAAPLGPSTGWAA